MDFAFLTYAFAFIKQPLVFLFAFVIGIWIFCDYIRISTWVQIKEYRQDRIKDFLKTPQGKNWFINKPFVYVHTIWFLSLFFYLWLNHVSQDATFEEAVQQLIGFFSYLAITGFFVAIVDILYILVQKIRKRLVFPKFTKKLLLLVVTAVFIEIMLVRLAIEITLFFALAIPFFFRPAIMQLSAFVLSFPTRWAKAYYVAQARKKLKRFPKMHVIGITGSYGKSTVKTFLGAVLSKKFITVTTPKNINTEIGVARFILETDFSDTEVFVVEMGAYAKGEIKLISDMVQPNIGILTTIAPQHLSLFGSIETIQKTKYELLRAVSEDGLVITNQDNSLCIEFLNELTAKKIKTFSMHPSTDAEAIVIDAKTTHAGVTGIIKIKGENTLDIAAPVFGVHQLQNLAPVVLVAQYMGMSDEEIVSACSHIQTPDGTLQVKKNENITYIDDSYNANPDGFIAAIEILAVLAGDKKTIKKVVITRGMLELDTEEENSYKHVSKALIKHNVDILMTIDQHAYDLFEKFLTDSSVKQELVIGKNALATKIEALRASGDQMIILFENRVPISIDSLCNE